ncbi:MAG: hypothetical protein ABIQ32_12195 [Sphingomicrobium sp.]
MTGQQAILVSADALLAARTPARAHQYHGHDHHLAGVASLHRD